MFFKAGLLIAAAIAACLGAKVMLEDAIQTGSYLLRVVYALFFMTFAVFAFGLFFIGLGGFIGYLSA